MLRSMELPEGPAAVRRKLLNQHDDSVAATRRSMHLARGGDWEIATAPSALSARSNSLKALSAAASQDLGGFSVSSSIVRNHT